MRIKVNFSPNTEEVPNNNSVMLEYVHRCLGRDNEYHDKASSYNVSHFYGGDLIEGKTNLLNFPKGGYFVISSTDDKFINSFLLGLLNNSEISYGMKYKNIQHMKENLLDGWNHFATLSPFIIKKIISKKEYSFLTLNGEYKRVDGKYCLTKDEGYDFQQVVKNYLVNKLSKIDNAIDLSSLIVKIDEVDKNGKKHNKHKVKTVFVNHVLNYANQCQLSIFCSKKVAELLYNIGIGQSTGAGFGTIYKTENHHLYRNKNSKKTELKKEEELVESN